MAKCATTRNAVLNGWRFEMSQISCIETHIEMLMEPEELERIGADKGDNRELQLRVLRIFAAFNKLQAENERLKQGIIDDKDAEVVLVPKEIYDNLEAKHKRLKKERDFAKKIADMYISELGLTVKRIKQNLNGFDQALKGKPATNPTCKKCEGAGTVFKEGFYPCPDCNEDSVEYQNKKFQAKIEQLKALCLRESKVLKEALTRKNNKSMIKVVANSLEEHALKGDK